MNRVVLLLFALSCASARPAGAEEPALTPAEYRASLERIEAALKAGEWPAASSQARELAGRRVRYGTETLGTDTSLLEPLAAAPDASARRFQVRVARLAEALKAWEGADRAPDGTEPDAGLLERVRQRQAAFQASRGGEVGQLNLDHLPAPVESFWVYVSRKVRDGLSAVFNVLLKLLKWVFTSAPRLHAGQPSELFGPFTLMLILIFLGVLALFVLDLVRKHRRQPLPPPPTPAARATAEDEDPTSRADREWEAYAQDLLRGNRAREAVRAYYHAVLAALFAAGLLNYRKGRTNWEYYRELAPEHGWRPLFREATSVFERIWYGRQATGEDDCLAYATQVRRILDQVRPAREKA